MARSGNKQVKRRRSDRSPSSSRSRSTSSSRSRSPRKPVSKAPSRRRGPPVSRTTVRSGQGSGEGTRPASAPALGAATLVSELDNLLDSGSLDGFLLRAAARPSSDLPGFRPPPSDDDIKPELIDPDMGLDKIGGLEEQVKYLNRRILAPLTAGMPSTGIARAALKPVKGVVFYGPPGTGKTVLAKSLAATLSRTCGKKVSFFMRKGTDVYSKWVGESEQNLRKLFAKAQEMSPSIIFLDEIDGLCPARKNDSHHHTTSVTVSLLGLMDNVKHGEVFVIGATNRLSSLDPAMLRPGRFDQHLYFSAPNEAGRLSILNIKLKDWDCSKPRAELLQEIARAAVGYTGADLVKLIDTAVDIALERSFPKFGTPGDATTATALDRLQVLREDWLKALATTHKSNPEVFGGSSYTGDVMDERVRPLIEGIVEEIRSKVLDYTNEIDVCLGNKGVLVWTPSDNALLDIDYLLIPAVIGTLDNRLYPAFHLKPSSPADVLSQALISADSRPTILVVPRIDVLYMLIQAKSRNMDLSFLDQFERARGKNLTILASAACDVQNLPQRLQRLFQDKEMPYRLRPVSAEERKEFFCPLFNYQSKYHNGTSRDPLNKLLDRIVEVTDKDEIGSLTTIHGQLTNACTQFWARKSRNHSELVSKFKDIVESYAQKKLGTSTTSAPAP